MNLVLELDRNGGYSTRANRQLMVLSKFVQPDAAGIKVVAQLSDGRPQQITADWMIVKRIAPGIWAVAPVTEDHVLVHHNGFECIGPMCCTTAFVPRDLGAGRFRTGVTITPGSLNTTIRHVNNVNAGHSIPVFADELAKYDPADPNLRRAPATNSTVVAYYRQLYKKPVPDVCYVKRGETRVAGVPGFEQIEPAFLS